MGNASYASSVVLLPRSFAAGKAESSTGSDRQPKLYCIEVTERCGRTCAYIDRYESIQNWSFAQASLEGPNTIIDEHFNCSDQNQYENRREDVHCVWGVSIP